MPKLKPGTIIPTPKEDAEINAQIKADSDDFEWTKKISVKQKPLKILICQSLLKMKYAGVDQRSKNQKYYSLCGIAQMWWNSSRQAAKAGRPAWMMYYESMWLHTDSLLSVETRHALSLICNDCFIIY